MHRLLHPHGAASVEPPLEPSRICELLRGVVAGMHFLHDTMGVVHGDLKPLNLLLHQGQIKLCDFGSSRLLRRAAGRVGRRARRPRVREDARARRKPRMDLETGQSAIVTDCGPLRSRGPPPLLFHTRYSVHGPE